MSKLPGDIRNHRGETVEPTYISATDVKNEFGQVMEGVLQGSFTVITKHGDAKAILISVDNFNALWQRSAGGLDTLSKEFDTMLERMQTVTARKGMKAAFDASPKHLGRAAVRGSRRS